MSEYFCAYIKSDYEPLVRTYVFTEEAAFRRFLAGAEADGTYWGRRILNSMPTEHLRDTRFTAPVMMS